MPPKQRLIHLVAAARPNFMKVAPLHRQLAKEGWARPVLVHTGQHYDYQMSQAFLDDLGLPEPGVHLGVGSGSHAEQTGQVMMAYEKVLARERPDWVVVVGDVNSTMAATIAAVKLGLLVAHLEAGLRSFDRTMPEEINRLVTDALAHLLLTPSPDGDENLLAEGVDPARIKRVGNIMIDSFEMMRPAIEKAAAWKGLGFSPEAYGVVTLHRPGNVDRPEVLAGLADTLAEQARRVPLVFPVHPRTKARLVEFGLWERLAGAAGLTLREPLGYLDFMSLVTRARLVITDSGGVQEETSYLGIPCLTLRPNTERPVTISQGSNQLVKPAELADKLSQVLAAPKPAPARIELWDGAAAGRVAEVLKEFVR